MADRTVTVNIKYKVDGLDIQKSEAAVKSAQAATDQLRASAQKMGAEGQKSSQQYKASIGSLQQEMQRLKTLIENTSRSDTKLLNERIAKYRQLKSEVDNFNKSLNAQGKQTQSLASQFSGLVASAKLFLGATLAKEFLDMTLSMATLAGNIDGVSRAFNRAFPNAALVMDDLRKSTHGTITDFELMQRTLMASNFGIPIEKMGVLLEFAAVRAQQTGQSVDYLVDSIVRGIGMKSILRLDNLGLSASRLKEQFNGAALASRSIAEITEGVARIAEEELGKMGGYAETSATAVDQLKVSFQELNAQIAKIQTTLYGSKIIEGMTRVVNDVRYLLLGTSGQTKDFIQNEAKEIVRAFQDTVKELSGQPLFDEIQQKINSTVQIIGRYNDEISRTAKRQKQLALAPGETIMSLEKLVSLYGKEREAGEIGLVLTKQQINLRRQLNEQRERELAGANGQLTALQNNKKILEETIPLLKGYYESILKAGETVEQLGLIEAKLAEIEAVTDDIKTAKSVEEIERLQLALNKLNAELADLKALGVTKFTLKVNGQLKLVPVVDPKDVAKKLKFDTPDSVKIFQEDIEAAMKRAIENIPPLAGPTIYPVVDDSATIGEAFKEAQLELTQGAIDITAQQLISIQEAELMSYEVRLRNLREFYDEQYLLAGNNDRAKNELRLKEERETNALRKRLAEKEKQAAKFNVIINTAAAIAKTTAAYPFPYWLPMVALIAAQGASQLAIINRTPARFAKGGINIQDRNAVQGKDSIPALIMPGESVMTVDETRKSMGILKGIRAGKIDDRVLQKLELNNDGVKVVGMDDSRIVNAIEKQRYPDLVRVGSVVYEARKQGDNYRKLVRSKSMGK